VPTGVYGQECDLATHLPAGTSLDTVDPVAASRAAHILDMQALKLQAQRNGFKVY
jgi:hypothetical protein